MLNFGFIKRIMLSVLSVLVGLIYHAKVHGYVAYSSATVGVVGCAAYCRSRGYTAGEYGSEMISSQGRFNASGITASSCYCLSAAEDSAADSCRNTPCSSNYPGSAGNMRYTLSNGLCNGVAYCLCSRGYYTNSQKCVICPVGYYCPGQSYAYSSSTTLGRYPCTVGRYAATTGLTTCAACTVGRYAATTGLSTCAACPAGRYGATTGLSTCASCPSGRYASTTGMSTCALCDPNKATNSYGTGATACNWCLAYYPAYGTTPSSEPAYSNSGSAGPAGNCYIKSTTGFTDSTGTWYFTSNCYYKS